MKQLNWWADSETYKQKIVRLMRQGYALSQFSDEQILQKVDICRQKYRFWYCDITEEIIEIYKADDEPTDAWFRSRVFDELMGE